MANKQSRRSVSLNRGLYDRAKEFCHARNVPLAKFTEAAITRALEEAERAESHAAIGVAPATTG
jgi:hypothetical protein